MRITWLLRLGPKSRSTPARPLSNSAQYFLHPITPQWRMGYRVQRSASRPNARFTAAIRNVGVTVDGSRPLCANATNEVQAGKVPTGMH